MRVCRGGRTREHADPKTTAVPTLTGLLPQPLGKGPTAPASHTRRLRLRAECLTHSTPEAGRRRSRIPILGSSCGSGRPLNGRVVCGSPCHPSWDPSIQPSLTSVNTRRTSVAVGESRPRGEHRLKWPGISPRQDCDRPSFWPWSVGLDGRGTQNRSQRPRGPGQLRRSSRSPPGTHLPHGIQQGCFKAAVANSSVQKGQVPPEGGETRGGWGCATPFLLGRGLLGASPSCQWDVRARCG